MRQGNLKFISFGESKVYHRLDLPYTACGLILMLQQEPEYHLKRPKGKRVCRNCTRSMICR